MIIKSLELLSSPRIIEDWQTAITNEKDREKKYYLE